MKSRFLSRLRFLPLCVFAVAVGITVLPVDDAFAQRGRSSSPVRSSPIRSSRPATSGWGSKPVRVTSPRISSSPASLPKITASTPPARTPSWGTSPSASKPTTTASKPIASTSPVPTSGSRTVEAAKATAKKPDSAEAALFAKAKQQGTVFSSRSEAVQTFKAKEAASLKTQYPSSFSNEPSVRPSYIPSTYVVGGAPVTVIYRPELGGYGYWSGVTHSYILYSVLDNDLFLASQMRTSGYYYGSPPGSRGGVFVFLIVVICLAFLVAIIWFILAGQRTNVVSENSNRRVIPAIHDADISFEKPASTINYAEPRQTKENFVPPKPTAPPSKPTFYKNSPDFWREIRPTSIITLTDLQAVKESLSSGAGAEGKEYTVDWVYQLKEVSELAEWLFIKMDGVQDDILYLFVLIADAKVSLSIFYAAGGFEPCLRSEALDKKQEFLFAQPDNTENYRLGDLVFTGTFPYNLTDENGNTVEVTYRLKNFGTQQAMAYRNPPEPRLLATISQYSADNDGVESPEAMILELGNPTDENGGLISLYLGNKVTPEELSVLNS